MFNAGDDDNNNNNNDNNNDHDDHDDDNDNDISDNDINNNNNNNNNNSNNNNNWLTNLCDNYRQKKVNELKHNFKLGNIIAVKFKLVFLSIPLLTFEGLPRWISSFSTCKAHSSFVGFSLLIFPSR